MDTTLYFVVRNNEVEKLQELVENGADVDEMFEDDQNISTKSILHVCCEKGRLECTKILIDAGATLAVRDKWGQTPLMYSMISQYSEIAELLLSTDADLAYDQDCYGKSPLHCAVEGNCLELVELLIKYDANVDVRTCDGITPLMFCILSGYQEDPSKTTQILINAGADVHKKAFRCKRTALQMAAVGKKVKIVEQLLAAGSDPNTLDGTGRTPLTNIMWEHIRVRDGHCDIDADIMTIILMLIQAGADLNMNVCEYSNSLITAAFLKAEPLVTFLLDQGAKVDIKFASLTTPLLVAVSRDDARTVKTLVKWNSNMTHQGRIYKKRIDKEYMFDSFELALDKGNFEIVKVLMHAGYRISWSRQPYLFSKDTDLPDSLKRNPEMLLWLQTYATMPLTLNCLAVYAIRQVLGLNVVKLVESLPLPAKVKDLVLLNDM